MTRHAVTKATVLLAASLAVATPTLAGDRAQFNAIGFSDDGRYFAFEEYGIQDGSGFPYSNTFIIDLPADKWVNGTPVRVQHNDETVSIGELRRLAAKDVAGRLDTLGIDSPATILALNGDGEPDATSTELRFGTPGYGLEPVQDQHRLELDVFDLPPGEDCAIIDNATKGFALTLDGAELTRDAGKLPKSRGCAMDYRLYAVVAPADFGTASGAGVAIISTYPFGFEGPDRRFIAVPLGQ
jgi:predicted secreted protein